MKINKKKVDLNSYKAFYQDTRGSFLILSALSMVALLGIVGLAIDSARAMHERNMMQNAADIAVLAATTTYMEHLDSGASLYGAYTAALATADRFYAANHGNSVANGERVVAFGMTSGGGIAATINADVDTTFSRVLALVQ